MRHLRTLNKYLVRYKWHLLLGIVFITISNLYRVWAQSYVGNGVNAIAAYGKILEQQDLTPQQTQTFYSTIFNCILMYVVFNLIMGFFLFCQRQTIIVMSRRIEYDLKNDIYQKYQQLPVSFYQRNSTGDVMNRISEDVTRIRMYPGPGIMYITNLVVLLIVCISQMISVSWELTLYVLIPLPLMCWLVFRVSSRINEKSTLLQQKQSALSSRAQEDFSAIRLIKTFGIWHLVFKFFDRDNDLYKKAGEDLLKTESMFTPAMTVLSGLSVVIAVGVGGMMCMDGKITVGDISTFVLYIQMLTMPFAMVGWISSVVQRAAVSQERINAFLNEPTMDEKLEKGAAVEKDFDIIRFSQVSFKYNKANRNALDEVSFELKRGKTLGIIGKTGSGKTTIANVLNGEHSGYTGSITIGQNELSNIALNDLRNKMSVVPQEAFLFSDTIANNIAFGAHQNEKVHPDAIRHYAQKAVVHHNIMGFEKGYDTVVGERGITLSGGQKQRITIARALIREPEILIFDDCLSAVDAETEREILGNLVEQMKGKTTLLISHRVSTVMHADEIIVMDKGRLIEKGSHAELLSKKGLYYNLYKRQTSQ